MRGHRTRLLFCLLLASLAPGVIPAQATGILGPGSRGHGLSGGPHSVRAGMAPLPEGRPGSHTARWSTEASTASSVIFGGFAATSAIIDSRSHNVIFAGRAGEAAGVVVYSPRTHRVVSRALIDHYSAITDLALDAARHRAYGVVHQASLAMMDAAALYGFDERTGRIDFQVAAPKYEYAIGSYAVDPGTGNVFVAMLPRVVAVQIPSRLWGYTATGRQFLNGVSADATARFGLDCIDGRHERVIVGLDHGGNVELIGLDARTGHQLWPHTVQLTYAPAAVVCADALGQAAILQPSGSVSILDTRMARFVSAAPFAGGGSGATQAATLDQRTDTGIVLWSNSDGSQGVDFLDLHRRTRRTLLGPSNVQTGGVTGIDALHQRLLVLVTATQPSQDSQGATNDFPTDGTYIAAITMRTGIIARATPVDSIPDGPGAILVADGSHVYFANRVTSTDPNTGQQTTVTSVNVAQPRTRFVPPGPMLTFRLARQIAGAPLCITCIGEGGAPPCTTLHTCTISEIAQWAGCEAAGRLNRVPQCWSDRFPVAAHLTAATPRNAAEADYEVDVYPSIALAQQWIERGREEAEPYPNAGFVPLQPIRHPINASEWMRGSGGSGGCLAEGAVRRANLVLIAEVPFLVPSSPSANGPCGETFNWVTRVLHALYERASAYTAA